MTRRKNAMRPQWGKAWLNIEQSNSPARGMLTMFIEGRLDKSRIVDMVDDAQANDQVKLSFGLNLAHLRFGVNRSFNGDNLGLWVDNLRHFLREGFWCSWEMQPRHVPMVEEYGLFRQARFIPLINLDVPFVGTLGHNATLEIVDTTNTVRSAPLGSFRQSQEPYRDSVALAVPTYTTRETNEAEN